MNEKLHLKKIKQSNQSLAHKIYEAVKDKDIQEIKRLLAKEETNIDDTPVIIYLNSLR